MLLPLKSSMKCEIINYSGRNESTPVNDMKRIAIIPARSGSKGVPDKNLQKINGISLLSRAVQCALEADLFERIFVSTDSETYASEVEKLSVEMPWLRPPELASDTALVADAIRHTLDTFAERGEVFDTLCLLEPSSPLRSIEIVRQTVFAAEAEGRDAAFTVSPVPVSYHPLKQFEIGDDGAARFVMSKASANVNRQSLAPTYIRNGLAYAVDTTAFLAQNSIHGTSAEAIVVDEPVISIDNPCDFEHAEQLLSGKS